jgi:hypothetical protein
MLHKTIPSKPDQGSPVVSREKSAANHFARRILFGRNVKVFLGFSVSRGITLAASRLRIERKGVVPIAETRVAFNG